MVSSKRAGNPASYQRSINQGIRKVIGSSNRGFASTDPERQRGIDTGGAGEAPGKREGRTGGDSTGNATPGTQAERGKTSGE